MPTHPYLYEGRRVKGVTTIIGNNLGWNKRPLMYWAWTQGRDGLDYRQTTQHAADIGTIAHEMVECDLRGVNFNPTPYASNLVQAADVAFEAWQDWRHEREFEPILLEEPLVGVYVDDDGEFPFGGTIDIAAMKFRTKKVRTIIDLKTSNATYPDHKIQIAGYGLLWELTHPGEPIERYTLLRIDKTDGSFHYHHWPQLDAARQAFILLLKLESLKERI